MTRDALAEAPRVATVTGVATPEELGPTLMHEHLSIAFPGWRSDPRSSAPARAELRARGIDRIHEMQAAGIRTMVDPCPIDLGRDPELAADLSAATGFRIVMATGLYLDAMAASHWKLVAGMDGAKYLAEVFVGEITRGIEGTDVRAGVIKVATGPKRITNYERVVLEAAAIASNATSAPITTHTDRGLLGDDQQALLIGHGVPAQRIIIGHSCATADHAYHTRIAARGSYLGFDRFGIESEMPDAKRTESLAKLIHAGFGDRVVVSQDTAWCWYGRPTSWPEEATWHVLRFVRDIAPALREQGVSDPQVRELLEGNPRRYFSGESLPVPGER